MAQHCFRASGFLRSKTLATGLFSFSLKGRDCHGNFLKTPMAYFRVNEHQDSVSPQHGIKALHKAGHGIELPVRIHLGSN